MKPKKFLIFQATFSAKGTGFLYKLFLIKKKRVLSNDQLLPRGYFLNCCRTHMYIDSEQSSIGR